MFCNKKNVNILTSLLIAHGVRKAVVCPGSRNAPIVHNLNESPEISCYPVTDERSASFYALGIALADDNPVAVCVTSGSALLNLAPAVAEAYYRGCGIIVISADRPAAWIDQLDGQTLPQHDAFGRFTACSVTLPEPSDDEECWYCNRLINEALSAVRLRGHKPVHINVPISEPLFEFNTPLLPNERKITILPTAFNEDAFRRNVADRLFAAGRPMIVVGQTGKADEDFERALKTVSTRFTVLAESLASESHSPFETVLAEAEDDASLLPDCLLYMGGTLVSKRLKKFLRRGKDTETWAVSPDGEVHDTFMNLVGVIEGDCLTAMNILADEVERRTKSGNREDAGNPGAIDYAKEWSRLNGLAADKISAREPEYSADGVVREFEMSLEDMDYNYHVHYANSTAVRLANVHSGHYVWCNRGVNGIEGSLSTAAGFSLATGDMVFCVIGDLSFFYDQNALWNSNIGGNLRIILLNNGGGGIFYGLPGLKESAACDRLIAGRHETMAQGICTQCDAGYLSAHDMTELHIGLATLMTAETARPMVLEVFL